MHMEDSCRIKCSVKSRSLIDVKKVVEYKLAKKKLFPNIIEKRTHMALKYGSWTYNR